ncbi:recombination protein RecT [Methylobacillus rhizosphaerae]|uniref:Recombination protein RecT n=1 Tax=Methylobacillus rhizosphaerae TaxID=551994 RepID=A0A239ATC6_9PROT|nr:recombinase RecT [Methylobacillus rhizosphaerae]SNR98779.1 recombination protein RecT [Methylobacillus rhizosphaerae]
MASQQGTQALKAVATGRADSQSLAAMKPKDQIAELLKRKQGEIAKMLPRHLNPERLLKVAQIAATTTPALLECEVASLVGAIGQCAQMGLEPNTVLGHAYLVPFNTKRKRGDREEWVKSVQVIIGYKGLIDLARRSGQIVSISAHEVYANDAFELIYGLDEKLTHTPSFGDRGLIIGFYAVAKLKDGGTAFEFMSDMQVREIMAASQSKGKYGPWKDHYVEMGRKTVIRRLAKYLPLSIEFQTAAALDGQAAVGKDQHLDNLAIDGDFSVAGDDPLLADYSNNEGGATEQPAQSPEPDAPQVTFDQVLQQIERSTDQDVLDVAADLIQYVDDFDQQQQLNKAYKDKADSFKQVAE